MKCIEKLKAQSEFRTKRIENEKKQSRKLNYIEINWRTHTVKSSVLTMHFIFMFCAWFAWKLFAVASLEWNGIVIFSCNFSRFHRIFFIMSHSRLNNTNTLSIMATKKFIEAFQLLWTDEMRCKQNTAQVKQVTDKTTNNLMLETMRARTLIVHNVRHSIAAHFGYCDLWCSLMK